jgi:hypothetical protein
MKPPLKIKYKVNRFELKRELLLSMSKKNNVRTFERNLRVQKGELLVKKIEREKKEMIKDFLNLKVTQEILAGPASSNISGTLGGYGNLFSFIGFDQGDNPIDPIIRLLEQTKYRLSGMDGRGQMKLTIEMPSSADIFGATPLPWAPGISWAQRIEIGLSGLGMYLSKSSDKSRSGTGVQANNQVRSGKFSNTPYISSFINKWQQKFLKIDKDISLRQ